MRCPTRPTFVIFMLHALCFSCAATEEAALHRSEAKPIALVQYQQELARIDERLKSLVDHPERVAELRSSIPQQWEVHTSSGNFEIDNQDLRFKLAQYNGNPAKRGEILPELEYQVENALEETRNFERPAEASARSKLEAILQGPEYRSVSKTQSPLQRLKDALIAWMIRQFMKFFQTAAAHPGVSQVLIWSIVGLLTFGFAIWIYLLVRRTARDEYSYGKNGDQLAPSSKHWEQWLREARAAAIRNDWRDAIHLAYWAAISYLESSGTWKPDRARTPREYLRMLPDVSGRREPLEALTRRFELTWYACETASTSDFDFVLSQLEKIGCR